ncbi:HNH endonuclease signature motif containing protein [Corynebacterium simulans]
MNALADFLAAQAPGMAILAGAHGRSEAQLVQLGASNLQARELIYLAGIYFGPTSSSRRQRNAQGSAHSLSTLTMIEGYISRIPRQRDKWKVREALCTSTLPADKLKAKARAMAKEYAKPREPQEGVRITRRRQALWSLTVTCKQDMIADIFSALKPEAPVQSFYEGFFSGAHKPVAGSHVVITLDEFVEIAQGGGEEIQLRMTNGASISGADFVSRVLSAHGLVSLVHPYEGPVNLYRTRRFANEKQRLLAAAENPTCAWPGCNHPADSAQVHHLTSWARGGDTNIGNLVTCCAYHNGINDDSPPGSSPKTSRGKLARIRGKITWLPPWASPVS